MNLNRLSQCYDRKVFNAEALERKDLTSDLFREEINYCLTSLCDCISFHCDEDVSGYYNISLRPSSVEHKRGCGECTVEMPNGTLHVNTEITIRRYSRSPTNFSLIFIWTSKAKSLSVSDKQLLQKARPIHSLPIYVDL